MITVWIKRTRAKKILCLVRFDYLFSNYFEVSFHYFRRRCNKKIKVKFNNLTFAHRSLSKIPEGYDGKNVIFMSGEVIYNHEVVKKVLYKWKER